MQAHPTIFVQPPPGTILVGCGASAQTTAKCSDRASCLLREFGLGQLLFKLKPDQTLAACDVGSKDHRYASPGTITGYALGITLN